LNLTFTPHIIYADFEQVIHLAISEIFLEVIGNCCRFDYVEKNSITWSKYEFKKRNKKSKFFKNYSLDYLYSNLRKFKNVFLKISWFRPHDRLSVYMNIILRESKFMYDRPIWMFRNDTRTVIIVQHLYFCIIIIVVFILSYFRN